MVRSVYLLLLLLPLPCQLRLAIDVVSMPLEIRVHGELLAAIRALINDDCRGGGGVVVARASERVRK